MPLPPLMTIGLIANQVALTISVALLLLILWQSRQRTSLLFAVFLLAVIASITTIIIFRLSPVFGFDPTPWMYADANAIAAYGVLLFIFTSEFTGKNSQLARIVYLAGGLLWIVATWLTWTGHLIVNVEVTPDGATLFDFTLIGIVMVAVLVGFEGLALVSLLINPTDRSRALVPGVVVLIVAALGDLHPTIASLPVNSMLVAVASLMLSGVILRLQLFNPLARLNRDLARANAELERASQLKSQFLASMSHELRTPLNSIIGYTELVLNGLYGPVTETQQDRLSKVLRNGQNLLNLINDILDLSKIEAGRTELSVEAVDVRQLLDVVAATVYPLIKEKRLELRVNVPDDLPPARADETRLNQMVTNLLSNAVKFTKEGGVTVDAGFDRGRITIRVRDTGIGIPQDQLESIFDEFIQVDSTTTREHGGTGLGLTITRRLARLQGGDVTVESELGQGSTFTITLPSSTPPAESVAPAVDTPHSPLVLVIDDEPEAADIIKEHLIAAGYRVEVAHRGADGLRLARERSPAAITLDIMMPGMDGWEVFDQLRSDSTTARVPVILVSILDEAPLALELDGVDHVVKPIKRGRLLTALRRAIIDSSTQHPILIVDDNPDDRDLISTILSSEGYAVVVVPGGEEAITWLDQHAARLVVLDLMMPRVSGFDVLAHIRTRIPNPNLPVVVLTAKALTPEEETFLSARFADVVRKQGLVKDDLLAEIRASLAR